MSEQERLIACVLCRQSTNEPGCGGPCPCPVDRADIASHAKASYCPLPAGPRYGTATAPEGWADVPVASAGTPVAPRAVVARPVQPVPREKWPRRVKLIARYRTPEDKGVGDTIARLVNEKLPRLKGVDFGDAFKAFSKKMGIDCGCDRRQDVANLWYPY